MSCNFCFNPSVAKQMPAPPVRKAIAGLFECKELSDINVICGNHKFPAHRIVLKCIHVAPFSQALDEDAKMIDLPNEEWYIVRLVLKYLYTNDYTKAGEEGSVRDGLYRYNEETMEIELSPIEIHARVYAFAHRYEIAKLCTVALSNLAIEASTNRSGDDFAKAVKYAYTVALADAEELRSECVDIVVNQHADLLQKEDYPGFHEVLDQVPVFAADIMRALVAQSTLVLKEESKVRKRRKVNED